MSLEKIAEFGVLTEHVEALVAAEPLQLGRMDAALHAGGERARLRLWPPRSRAPKPAATARAWTTWATVCGVIALVSIRGRGGELPGGKPFFGCGGSQMR